MIDTQRIEEEQSRDYPGISVRREGEAVVVHVPVKFRKRSGSCRIVTPEGKRWRSKEVNQPLIEALAKGLRWQEKLESGEVGEIQELARAEGVNRSTISRMMRLTSLAPDIVEKVLAGEEPDGLSLRGLYKELPVEWGEQRVRFSTPRE